jgi:hypothetical protein
MKNCVKILILFGLTMLLWGCDSVEPWEKGALAQYSMLPERDPLETAMADHVYYTREAAHGGSGVGGGGCGCN